MTPQQAMDGLTKKNREITILNDSIPDLRSKQAAAERDYHIALATKITKLKIESHPVTLIPKLAQGDRIVADLKYQADVADGVLRACFSSIKIGTEAIGTYRSVLTFLREEMFNS
ncbi:MAG: hypothetical protein GY861_16655 [bacterium]|nr:hypothetical protein [bacterium]